MTDTASSLGEDTDIERPLVALIKRYGRADGHYLGVGVLLVAAKSFIGFADVFVIGLAIDALFNDRPLALPLVPDAWIPTEPIPLLVFAAGIVFLVNITTIVWGSSSDICLGVFAQRILHRIRVETFDAAQHRNLDYFDEHRTGDVMSALNDDVNQLETFFTVFLGALVWIVVTLVAALVYMSLLNWQLAVFVLAAAPLVGAVNYWYSHRLDPLQAEVREERGALNAQLETGFSGVPVVKAFTAEADERDRVEAASHDHFRARFDARRCAVQQAPINRLIAGTWLLVTLALGIYWIVVAPPLFFTGTLTVGQLVPFLFYMERVTLPLKNLSGVIEGYNSSNAAARRILGLSDPPADTRNHGDGTDQPVIDGAVEFDRVSFRYSGADRPAVDDVSFDVDSGETIGLVGATGAGKSTVIKLLLRLYDDDSGAITVDGRDVRDISPRALRAAIGYVNQDAFLFNGTVRHNLVYGTEGEVSDERVHEAAKKAGVHEEILDLPEGYDTEVGDRGVRLSGGQRQRIAIARAIVADPPILVLDEATSHVDTETERVIQRQLAALTVDRTTFVVAHRLSTVRGADRILVLDDGAIVEQGTHADLLDADGAYARLWNAQVGKIEAETA
ncbi:MAG: ATP-binding cassette subfamily B protein [Natronomonas sp.]|jgi:ATP-binding cassette subfamily B protein